MNKVMGALALFSAVGIAAAASTPASVICIAGQCVQGFTNLSLGAQLSAPNTPASVLILPGQYTSTTNPQLLHSLLTASSASLSGSPGFSNGAVTLPLDLDLQPGIAAYTQANFSGSPSFVALPSPNTSNVTVQTQMTAGSLLLSPNTWASVSFSNSTRLILWDTAPDLSQLPSSSSLSNQLTLNSMQSATCVTPCASGGTCTPGGTCACLPGFTGSSCETCTPGFFGPTCQACPAGCAKCDDGLDGTGICLKEDVKTPTEECNCANGVCGAGGACTCNAGWANASNGTLCAACAPGFFASDDGSCKVCNLGCTQCADSSGTCITCKSGFTQNPTDRTSCTPPSPVTSSGTICPDGAFSNGTACAACSPLCQTCTGPTSSDCVVCGAGRVALTVNGTSSCVQTDTQGVCQTAGGGTGQGLVADNNKHECEACPPGCTACGIPGFNVASTINQVQCSQCLPGLVLSKGQCVLECPQGFFLDPKDNLTCTACDSSCTSCAGSSTFCLTCANSQLASGGKCLTSCPSTTFSSAGSCTSCHPDCATCTGISFNQCSACPASRPVLTNGRCFPTCGKTEFFDSASGSCKACDPSCSSCAGAGPQQCLACADNKNVLRAGSCVPATCSAGTSVVPGLGACLSDLVEIPTTSASGTAPPLPSITGINAPIQTTSGGQKLQWWQILLMALGIAFLVLLVLICVRRRMRQKRAKQTAEFARQKNLDVKLGWRGRLVRFGERLFGHTAGERVLGTRPRRGTGPISLPEGEGMRDIEAGRASSKRGSEADMDGILDAYDYPRRMTTYSHSRDSSYSRAHSHHLASTTKQNVNRLSAASMYTEMTGQPRRTADARQPVREKPVVLPGKSDPTMLGTRNLDRKPLQSRFSASTYNFSDSGSTTSSTRERMAARSRERTPTPAEEYALSVLDTRFRDENAVRTAQVDFAPKAEPDYGILGGVGSNNWFGSSNANTYSNGLGGGTGPPRGEYWLRPTNTGDSSSSGGSASKNPFRR